MWKKTTVVLVHMFWPLILICLFLATAAWHFLVLTLVVTALSATITHCLSNSYVLARMVLNYWSGFIRTSYSDGNIHRKSDWIICLGV